MVQIILKMNACKNCGECCLRYCKGRYFKNGECAHPEKSKECKMFPIQKLDGKYYLGECVGVAKEFLPLKTLERIIQKLNDGKSNFEIQTDQLYFMAKE
jgi:hypothetical protein